MRESCEPQTLSEIAERSGFSMSDVAFVADLEESTVYRLWDSPEWLDKISGRVLQALIATVPDVGDYVAHFAVLSRRGKLIDDLAGEGLEVNEVVYKQCIADGIPEQYLSTALEAAVLIMRGESSKANAYLARFWGTGQDKALTVLFSTSPSSGLLRNPDQLIAASAELVPRLARKGYSFHTIITQAVFAHYVGKPAGALDVRRPDLITDRKSAFTFRSSIIGELVNGNDAELAERYRLVVRDVPVLRTMEEWSFPTYTRDTRPNSDFSPPRSLLLRNTAGEILSEINDCKYGDAYIYYLTST